MAITSDARSVAGCLGGEGGGWGGQITYVPLICLLLSCPKLLIVAKVFTVVLVSVCSMFAYVRMRKRE